jgi:hypothetical protein
VLAKHAVSFATLQTGAGVKIVARKTSEGSPPYPVQPAFPAPVYAAKPFVTRALRMSIPVLAGIEWQRKLDYSPSLTRLPGLNLASVSSNPFLGQSA